MSILALGGSQPPIPGRAGGGYRDAGVATPSPGRPTDSNMQFAHRIHAGLTAYDYSGQEVAGWLAGMPEDLQERLAHLIFPMLRHWASLADVTDQYGPRHPLYDVCGLARTMIQSVRQRTKD